jgi:hypothetical protein
MQRRDGGSRADTAGGARNGNGHLTPGGARWRRDQRARRRRLTRRGRTTVATLVSSAFAAAGFWVIDPIGLVQASARAGDLPAVEAAAPPPGSRAAGPEPAVVAPERAPEEVLTRLPISRDSLDLPETRPVGSRSSGRLSEELDRRYPLGPLRVEYTLDAELMRHVFDVLRDGRVELGNVVVMEPLSGRVLAYAATDLDQFPPTRPYPAASLVKVITAAAALDESPGLARLPCRFSGSPYRLTPARIDPPPTGRTISLRRALATSNNQCLAQLAVHALGSQSLLSAIARFGWLDPPAPAHAAGRADPGEEPYDLGRLGCGLAGSRITPLHAAQLAATLVHGELVAPRWVERVVDVRERELDLPAQPAPRRVLDPDLTQELRAMLVDTTQLGTARRAFRGRGGKPLLGPVSVAGKTGSLSGKSPDGRYEWFIGVAPADSPRIAVATVIVQHALWWRTASQIAADVLRGVFCDRNGCRAENVERYIQIPDAAAALASTRSASADRLN